MINEKSPPITPPPFIETREGDRLDWIAMRIYGIASGIVEQLLAANPGLASQPVWLPGGLTIVTPQLPTPKPQRVRLWS
jgi:phage tail protein X